MTSSAHERQREEDAALFEDWSEWKRICWLDVERRRFLVGPVHPRVGPYLMRIPGAEKIHPNHWRMSIRLMVTGAYVPAAEWRHLRRLLPAIVDYEAERTARSQARDRIYRETGHWVESPSPAMVAQYAVCEDVVPRPVHDGHHRRHAHASGASAPSDIAEAERVLSCRAATLAQRVYIRKLLRSVGRAEEAIPEMTTQAASLMIDALRKERG